MATRCLMHFALLVTTLGTKEVLDANSLLQLVTESGAASNASGAEEASAGAKPVEEIAAGELGAMEHIMEKELGVMGEELGVMEKSMGDIVDMKKMELGAVKREQGTMPVGPQDVDGPGPDDESPYPLAPSHTSGAQETRGATKNGTRVAQHIFGKRVLGNRDSTDPWADSPVEILDLTETDTDLRGFIGGFNDGTYGYVMPFYNSRYYSGKVARFDLAGFATVEVLDLTTTDPALKGFHNGFHDGTYGYATTKGKHAAGNFQKVARFDLAGFATVNALDLKAAVGDVDLHGGFSDGTYGYCTPGGGTVPRFDLASFSTVTTLRLDTADPNLAWYSAGFPHGAHGYIFPYSGHPQRPKMVRFDLAGFATVDTLDFLAVDPELKNFYCGFSDGTYGYGVPSNNGDLTDGKNGAYAKVPRFDLAGFSTVEVLDVSASDPTLKSVYIGGFTDGTYGYLIPWWKDVFYGKVARFDLEGFATVAALDLAATDPALIGFHYGFTDGTYGYAVPFHNRVSPGYYGKVPRFAVTQHNPDASGEDDQSSVVGDPHVVNVAHARFEIRAEGVHKLVQIPQLVRAGSDKPDLRVDAEIRHLVSSDCTKSFMTSLSIFGRWAEDAAGLMRISQGSDMPNTTLLINTQSPEEFFTQFPFPGVKPGRAAITFKLKDVSFHVGKHYEGRYGKQKAYLNVRIAGLKKYRDVGGLLGYDDHADAEKLDVNCKAATPPAAYQSSFIGNGRSVPTITDGGSRIEAE